MLNQDDEQFKSAAKMLENEDSSERYKAIEILYSLNTDQAYRLLLQALKDVSYSVRLQAATALGKLGDKRAVEPLVQALKDDDLGYSFNDALIELGRHALLPLLDALKTGDQEIRRRIVRVLGRLRDVNVFELLVQIFNDEEDNKVRSSIILALGDLEDSRAVTLLIQLLKDKDHEIRGSAAQALGWLKSSEATEALIETLEDQDQEVRQFAASSLGQIGDKRATKPLLKALEDNDNFLRMRVAEALGRIGDREAFEPLLKIMLDDSDPACISAAEGLGKLGTIAVIPLLEILETYSNDKVRQRVLLALGESGDNQAIKPLSNILSKETETLGLRVGAAIALGKIGGLEALEALVTAFKDENNQIRDAAVRALGNMHDKRAIKPIIKAMLAEENSNIFGFDAALMRIGSEAVEPLLDNLMIINSKARSRIITILGDIGDRRILPILEYIRQTDPDNQVQITALNNIRKIEHKF